MLALPGTPHHAKAGFLNATNEISGTHASRPISAGASAASQLQGGSNRASATRLWLVHKTSARIVSIMLEFTNLEGRDRTMSRMRCIMTRAHKTLLVSQGASSRVMVHR